MSFFPSCLFFLTKLFIFFLIVLFIEWWHVADKSLLTWPGSGLVLLKRKRGCHKIEAEFGLHSFHAQNTINRNTQNMSFAHHTAGRVLLSAPSYETFQTSHTNTHSEAGVLAVFCVTVCRSSCVMCRRAPSSDLCTSAPVNNLGT